ncbi:MAG: hypothetical protein AB7G40_02365 [Hyphomonadaceae bacterium]
MKLPRLSAGMILLVAAHVIVLAIVFVFFGPLDASLRYYRFSTLSKDEVVIQAERYIQDRAGGHQMACVYAVRCDSNRARLEMVRDLAAWDFQETKATIWQRRFDSSFCAGRTTNLALHLVPMDGYEAQNDVLSHARWDFFLDRFIPRRGRFQSGAFTDQPWERCTAANAVIRPRT